MKKVLWLASWYPNASNRLTGDFIQRQAEAVSAFTQISVVYVGKAPNDIVSSNIRKTNIVKGENFDEHIFYYTISSSVKIFGKLKAVYDYFSQHLKFIRQLRNKNELPDLVHVHVAMKAGLIALYIKWKYKIPYILTEHSTGYYSEANDSLFHKSFLARYFTRKVIRNASRFLPVSKALGDYINKNWVSVAFQKIANVVNTELFFPDVNHRKNIFRFVHISSLLEQKNPTGIVRSFIELRKQNIDAELVMAGPLSPELLEYVNHNDLENRIICTGEISYEQVGVELRNSSSLILFSFYENMPCVMLEALCTGIPVISTRVGGVIEVISDENGILIQAGNESELLEAMKQMMQDYSKFDCEKISRQARKQFSYQTIGKEITEVYQSVLDDK